MNITMKDEILASHYHITDTMECIAKEIGLRKGSYGFTSAEPVETETYTKGILFKKTYHKWKYKVLFSTSLEEVSLGKFRLIIYIDNNTPFTPLDNLLNRLEDSLADLQHEMEIIRIMRPQSVEIFNDEPMYCPY